MEKCNKQNEEKPEQIPINEDLRKIINGNANANDDILETERDEKSVSQNFNLNESDLEKPEYQSAHNVLRVFHTAFEIEYI